MIEILAPEELLETLEKIVRENDDWRTRRCVNLDAAESLISPRAKALLGSDLERRMLIGEIGLRHHAGGRYVDQLDAITTQLAKRLFGVSYVEHRPLSTSIANMIAIRCLTEVGDTIMALEAPRGHSTWRSDGYAGFRGLKVLDIPFDYDEWNIDVIDFEEQVRKLENKPKLIVVGQAAFLFPYPLREIAEIANRIGAPVWYDGAHVLGLIAGKHFQDPMREGAYLTSGTASKTLSGPLGGILLYNDEALDNRIRQSITSMLSALGHNRTPSLAATLIEMSKFGFDFGTQVIANAKALGKALDVEGFEVVGKNKGYTESHTVVIDATTLGGGDNVCRILEQGDLICSAMRLRTPTESYNGVRLGTTEITRLGMKEKDMSAIGSFFQRLILQREDPSKIRNQVNTFRDQFHNVSYKL